MSTTSYRPYDFLFGCGGNWRNAIHIACSPCRHPCKHDRCGFLMCADGQGRPILMSIENLKVFSGENIDPTECRGKIDRGCFEAAYSRFLTWQLTSANQCALCALETKLTTNL